MESVNEKTKLAMFAGEVLTGTEVLHSELDSSIAMRQKAVMEASESEPRTSPYTQLSEPSLSSISTA